MYKEDSQSHWREVEKNILIKISKVIHLDKVEQGVWLPFKNILTVHTLFRHNLLETRLKFGFF